MKFRVVALQSKKGKSFGNEKKNKAVSGDVEVSSGRKKKEENFKIGFWNVEGLERKLIESEFLHYLCNFDIFCLAETWLGKGKSLEINGYKSIVKSKEKKGKRGREPGGLAVLVREGKGVEYKIIGTKIDEVLWVKVHTSSLRFILGVVYKHPIGSVYWRRSVLGEIEEELLNIIAESGIENVVLLGDFNCRIGQLKIGMVGAENDWGCNLIEGYSFGHRKSKDFVVNREGKDLINFCEKLGLGILNGVKNGDEEGEFSQVGIRGNSVVDYGIVNREVWEVVQEFKIDLRIESDHMPIIIKIDTTGGKELSKIKLEAINQPVKRYNWSVKGEKLIQKKLKMESVKESLNTIDKLLTDRFISEADMYLRKFLDGICSDFVKKETKKEKRDKGWFNGECRELKKIVKKSLRKFRRGEETVDQYLEQKKHYKKICEKRQEEWGRQWVEELDKTLIDKTGKMFWKKIKSLKQSPQLGGNIENKEWEDHFKAVFQIEEGWEEEMNECGDVDVRREGNEELIGEVTKEEVLRVVSGLKNGKAAGEDGLTGEIFKFLTQDEGFAELLAKFINVVWEREIIPDSWGTGLIVPIFKGKGSVNEARNYRGVTLLNTIIKIYTGVIGDRLTKWAIERNVLVGEQAGFRKGFSTVDNAFVLNYMVERELQKGGTLNACFIDFQKAFDSVNREILWIKMRQLRVPEKIVRVIKSVYRRVEMKVCVNGNECTSGFLAEKGVRQGCKLSPLLFCLFINDLPDFFQNVETHAPSIGMSEVKMLIYADDVVLVSQTGVGLQRGLKRIEEYSQKYGLKVNVEKTKIVVFKSGKKRGNKFWYAGEKVEIVSTFKYLGLIFQETGGWKKHQEEMLKKTEIAMGILRRGLYKFKNFPVTLLFKILDTMIIPILMYGAEI